MKKLLQDMNEPEIKTLCNDVGHAIEYQMTRYIVGKPLFVAVLFNDPKVGQYVSNCVRADVIEALKELVERLEKREDVPR